MMKIENAMKYLAFAEPVNMNVLKKIKHLYLTIIYDARHQILSFCRFGRRAQFPVEDGASKRKRR